MATSPPTLAILGSFLLLFVGAAALGGGLADAFASGSWIAAVAGFFALPLAFAGGLQAWYGLALLSLIPRLLRYLRGLPIATAPRDPDARPNIPGSFVFLPFSSLAGAAAGTVVGIASSTHSAWLVFLVFWIFGTAHGALAWSLARRGYLVPPETI